jgi:hypothetical protein
MSLYHNDDVIEGIVWIDFGIDEDQVLAKKLK